MNGQAVAHGSLSRVRGWMASQEEPLPTLAKHVAHACVLTSQSMTPGVERVEELWELGAWLSWWGGPAVDTDRPWPRRRDGTPLVHIVTVHLADADSVLDGREFRRRSDPADDGLPTTGLLEVFHDLHTEGTCPRDDHKGAWCVRWTPEQDTRSLQHPPEGSTQPDGCICLVAMPGYTVPAPVDPPYVDSAPLIANLDAAWSPPEHGSQAARSYLYGHSRKGQAPVADLLQCVRPSARAPSHRLVASLSLPSPLTGWWPEGTTLEVWITTDDLEAGWLDRAWCLLR